VAYLTHYAERFELPVELDSPVRSLRREGGGYLLGLDGRTVAAEAVVVATGPFQVPRVPALAGAVDAGVHQLHSAGYRRPGAVPADGPVLVVGGGNTGFQIAEELAASHEVHLSIGSRQTPLPQRVLGRDLFTFLTATGLMDKTRDSRIGRRMRGRETLVGSSPRAARRRGIALHGRAVAAAGVTVRFAGRTAVEPRTIVWATGFGADHGWIDVPVFDDGGAVVHARGVTASPGLVFLGLPWQHTRGSALPGMGRSRRPAPRRPSRRPARLVPAHCRRLTGGRGTSSAKMPPWASINTTSRPTSCRTPPGPSHACAHR
jgi:putative flavoprotein involved in K+ transport